MKKINISLTFSLLVFSVVLLPIITYGYKFGFGFWDSHEDWGYMGSYFGGVMGPIMTSLSLFFLAWQIREQLIQRKLEFTNQKSNQCEKDILNITPKLAQVLNDVNFTSTIKVAMASYDEKYKLQGADEARDEVKMLVETYYKEFNLWLSIDVNFRGLASIDYTRYKKLTYYMLSECELEGLYYLNKVSNRLSNESNTLCTLLMKIKHKGIKLTRFTRKFWYGVQTQ
ncbi:hypothetical protein ACFL53_03755, partial [Pseudomonadota bacterium]